MKYAAIEALCSIVENSGDKDDILSYAYFAVGIEPEPTGINPEPTTKLKALDWGETVSDLRKRLIELADKGDIHEHILVAGLIEWIRNRLGSYADAEVAELTDNRLEALLRRLKADLAQPVQQREGNLPDESLNRLIQRTENSLENREATRVESGRRMDEFNDAINAVFTPLFWHEAYGKSLE